MSYAAGLQVMRVRLARAQLGGASAAGSLLAPLVAAAAIAGAHWITLRNNRRRVLLDQEGRIVAGLGGQFDGVHVRDVVPVSHALRDVQAAERDCKAQVARSAPATFPSADGAARALLQENPELAQLLEDDCSHDCLAYRSWLRGGRRGPKPQAGPGDGRFDALNERLELRGRRRVGSWLEAVHVTVPPSRRWEDFGERLPALEEATGLRLALPAPAERIAQRSADVEGCEKRADESIDEIMTAARRGRFQGAELAELEEVPF